MAEPACRRTAGKRRTARNDPARMFALLETGHPGRPTIGHGRLAPPTFGCRRMAGQPLSDSCLSVRPSTLGCCQTGNGPAPAGRRPPGCPHPQRTAGCGHVRRAAARPAADQTYRMPGHQPRQQSSVLRPHPPESCGSQPRGLAATFLPRTPLPARPACGPTTPVRTQPAWPQQPDHPTD